MTEIEFKHALLRGQGRCVIAVRENPQIYFNTVLWACGHEVAFDPQSEGTRSDYVYSIVKCYKDLKPFLNEAVSALRKKASEGLWSTLYFAELLNRFASDGYIEAKAALWLKYNELYASLIKINRPPAGYFYDRDDFESIAVVLSADTRSFYKIVEDIGRLFSGKSFWNENDFDRLWECKGKRNLNKLKELAQKSKWVAEYLKISLKSGRKADKPNQDKELPLYMQVKENIDGAADKAVKRYLEAMDREERANALDVFRFSPYPDDPLPILEDAEFASGHLKTAAFNALAQLRHPVVRDFALEFLQSDVKNFLPVFIKNYRRRDEKRLSEAVRAFPVDFKDTTGWHIIFSRVIKMADDGVKAPAELLYYIYEKSYCSCCREKVFRQLRKRKLLTEDIIAEGAYDSNEAIRRLSAIELKKQNKY